MNLLTTTDALGRFCESLAREKFITVDTEFIRETTFWPQLCLVQVAGERDAALIDPLARGISLAPFFALLQNARVRKVLHGGQQDIEIFYHATKQMPRNVFDTQIAAMVCGFNNAVGYESLVRTLLDKQISKRARFTDWSKRPLSEQQKDYALSDVTYLRDIYAILQEKITEAGRESWIADELTALVDPAQFDQVLDRLWYRLALNDNRLDARTRAFALLRWREEEARKRDRPRRHILKDEHIRALAKHAPRDEQELVAQRNLPIGFRRSNVAKSLLPVLAGAANLTEDDLPERPRPKQACSADVLALLKLLLNYCADEHKVAPKLLASSDELVRLGAPEPPADSPLMRGWRYEVFGKSARALVEGRLDLHIKNGALALRES